MASSWEKQKATAAKYGFEFRRFYFVNPTTLFGVSRLDFKPDDGKRFFLFTPLGQTKHERMYRTRVSAMVAANKLAKGLAR